MGQSQDNLAAPTRLFVNVKPGDCLEIGNTKLHVVSFTSHNRLRIRIEAPDTTLVNLTRSFEREVAVE